VDDALTDEGRCPECDVSIEASALWQSGTFERASCPLCKLQLVRSDPRRLWKVIYT
jgi:uncharacterized paraquat-inducible protein A